MLKKLYHKLWETMGKLFKNGDLLEDENLMATTNLFYGCDKVNNTFDMYYPKGNSEKMPTIIMIHGGGYISGEKEGTRSFCKEMAKKRFLVFNMEYTKCDKSEQKYFPYQVNEFYMFFNHLSENPRFTSLIDFENVFLAGDSAGAHIASLIANIQTNQELKMEFNLCGGPKIKGLILMSPSFGIYNFAGMFPKKPYHELIFGKQEIRNPLNEYTHNLNITTDYFPPTLMFSVKTDLVVGVHKRRFLKLAKELNLSVIHCEFQSGYKLFHSCMINYPEHYPHCFEKIEEFVNNAINNNFVSSVVCEQLFEKTNKSALKQKKEVTVIDDNKQDKEVVINCS